jgi:hypothetical protein
VSVRIGRAVLELSTESGTFDSGIQEAERGVDKLETRFRQAGSRFEQVGVLAADVGRRIGSAAQGALGAVTSLRAGLHAAVERSTQSLSNLASVASSSAAVISKFTKGNDELREKLEGLATNLAIAAPAIRGFGAAIRFATGPIGAIVTGVAAAIAIFIHWETVQRTIVQAVHAAWKGLGEFFGRLFGSIADMARGVGQILLGAFTFDMARIQAGVAQLKQGLGGLGQLGIDMGQQIAQGFQTALQGARDFLTGMSSAAGEAAKKLAEERKEEARTILEAGEAAANAELENRIATIRAGMEAERLAAAERGQLAASILEAHVAGQNAMLETTLARIRAEMMAEQIKRAAAVQTAALTLELMGALFGKGKAFALAQAIMNTALGVSRALAQVPWPYDIIHAALISALGLVQVHQIRSTKMAAGGIVRSRPGGIPAVLGEGGQDEAVIPLSRRRLAALGMGGEREIHAHLHLDGREIATSVLLLHGPGLLRGRMGPGVA